ncbi:unnamed protein product [Soboliphyme baturini]|uniref:Rap-GAP domain-containing protein n=1 Tax=Soboliphyme baturini TaxID=241478 RepID=A0A183J6W7_9BILA|nr:unnamed protein product [Soboliphyme baturini]
MQPVLSVDHWERVLALLRTAQSRRFLAFFLDLTENDTLLFLKTFRYHISYTLFRGRPFSPKEQVKEEEVFGNVAHSEAMDEFLNFLGTRVKLRDFKGYKGGLDTLYGQTGEESVYTKYKEREIMFHVSTLLPYSAGDSQQLQRKRHIGNDIVAIVFQDENTPFVPDMITSQFLHAYIIVQVVPSKDDVTYYKIAVAARDEVPFFGPPRSSPLFVKGQDFKNFLLSKLINAENACYKAKKFASLAERTRTSLLETLYYNLKHRSMEYCGSIGPTESLKNGNGNSSSGSLLSSVKKVIIGRNRSIPTSDTDTSDNSSSQTNTSRKWQSFMNKASSMPDARESCGRLSQVDKLPILTEEAAVQTCST